jgi:hypothetical protein
MGAFFISSVLPPRTLWLPKGRTQRAMIPLGKKGERGKNLTAEIAEYSQSFAEGCVSLRTSAHFAVKKTSPRRAQRFTQRARRVITGLINTAIYGG